MTKRALGARDGTARMSLSDHDDIEGKLMHVLLAGEPALGFRAIPGVASLPVMGSRSRWPVRPLLRTIRRWYCWSVAIAACDRADLFFGLDAPWWAKALVTYRRRRRALSTAVWASNSATARSAARAAASR
jgi:hypothetical protein